MLDQKVTSSEVFIPSPYMFNGEACDNIKKSCMMIIKRISEFQHVEGDDFDIICATFSADAPHSDKMTYATLKYLSGSNFLRNWIEFLMKSPIPNYHLIVYPVYFDASEREKVKTILHEINHIPDSKKGLKPHTGFGDEGIDQLYKRYMKVK